jgi:hypothetical protein
MSKGPWRARQMVASPTSYSRARFAMVSPAAYLSAILRRWLASIAEGRPNFASPRVALAEQ